MAEKNEVQEFINFHAREYYNSRINNNQGQMKAHRDAIMLKLYEKNEVSCFLLKTSRDNNLYKTDTMHGFDDSDALAEVMEFFIVFIEKYDYSKNDNFTAFFKEGFKHELSNQRSKFYTQKGVKADENGKKSKQKLVQRTDNESENKDGDKITISETAKDEYDPYDDIITNDSNKTIRIRLISLVTLYHKNKTGKAANQTRYSYYKIFTTEIVVNDIIKNNTVDIYDNKNEVMQALDYEYIDFVSFNNPKMLEDVLSIRIKKYSDIIDGAEEDVIKLCREPRVIIPYRFSVGLDEKPVTPAAVSQQAKAYKEEIEKILDDVYGI